MPIRNICLDLSFLLDARHQDQSVAQISRLHYRELLLPEYAAESGCLTRETMIWRTLCPTGPFHRSLRNFVPLPARDRSTRALQRAIAAGATKHTYRTRKSRVAGDRPGTSLP